MNEAAIAGFFTGIMKELQLDLNDVNLKETPQRWAKALVEQFTPIPINLKTFSDEPYSGLVTLVDHESWTLCPHHFERVQFKTSISYIPRGAVVVGASKLARICDSFSKGCVMQETFTRVVADYIMEKVDPEGCAVHVVGVHNCMRCRGVKTNASMITRVLRGIYMHAPQTREEFLSDLGRR